MADDDSRPRRPPPLPGPSATEVDHAELHDEGSTESRQAVADVAIPSMLVVLAQRFHEELVAIIGATAADEVVEVAAVFLAGGVARVHMRSVPSASSRPTVAPPSASSVPRADDAPVLRVIACGRVFDLSDGSVRLRADGRLVGELRPVELEVMKMLKSRRSRCATRQEIWTHLRKLNLYGGSVENLRKITAPFRRRFGHGILKGLAGVPGGGIELSEDDEAFP